MKLLPNNVQRLIEKANLHEQWDIYFNFCKDNHFRLRDIWVGFFLIAVFEKWITSQEVEDHLDSMALELYLNVQNFAAKVNEIDLNYDSLTTKINGRSLLAQTVENPAAVLIYCTTLFRRLVLKDPEVFQIDFAKKIRHLIAPLCGSLNLGFIKWRLEDMAFMILDPDIYQGLLNEMQVKQSDADRLVRHVCIVLKKLLESHSISVIDVRGRAKHFYGVYKKMLRKSVGLEEVYDQVALRILCHDVDTCYRIFDLINQYYRQIPEEYNDYISMPKENGYQSMHMAIYYDFTPVEIQIKTDQMHQFNEYGPAAHWMYKDHQAFGDKLKHVFGQKSFQEVLKDQVFVLTPEGDVISLVKGALPLDFAYAIHTEIGNRCIGALVNGRMSALNQPLQSGATVQILTRRNQHPTADWLQDDHTVSVSAKRHIRSWLRKHQEEDFISTPVSKGPAVKAGELSKVKSKSQTRPAQKVMIDHHLGKCCIPGHGDEILGYITRSRGMTVHRSSCKQIKGLDKQSRHRLQCLTWDSLGGQINRYRAECLMDCGHVTRKEVIHRLKNMIVAADWFTDEDNSNVAKLRCVLNLDDNHAYSKIKEDLLSITGVISFNKID